MVKQLIINVKKSMKRQEFAGNDNNRENKMRGRHNQNTIWQDYMQS